MLGAVPAAFVLFVVFGWKQMREGGGKLARLAVVSAGLAILCAIPLALPLALGREQPEFLMFVFAPATVAMALLKPLRRPGTSEPLPLATDAALLARIAAVAARMGVPAPRTRVAGTLGQMQAMAAVGGLQAPTMLLTDGLLFRLPADEQDAVIAHELAHLRTRSMWLLPLTGAFAATFAAACAIAAGGPPPIGFLFASLALCHPFHALVNRRVEHECDLRAARAIGFAAMAQGLDKVHAVHVAGGSGALARAFYAVATHPAPANRYEWLRARSGGELPERPEEGRALRLEKRLSRMAGAAFAAVLFAGAVAAPSAPALCAAILCMPLVAVLGLTLTLVRRARRVVLARVRQRTPGARLALAGVLTFAASFALLALYRPITTFLWRQHHRQAARLLDRCVPWTYAGVLIGFCLLLVGGLAKNRWNKLQARLAARLGVNDFAGAIAAAEARPRLLRRHPHLRHTVAVCRLLAGDRPRALAELERLAAGKTPASLLVLATLEVGTDPARALVRCREASALLPSDPACSSVLARCLRAAGLPAEAEAELARAGKLPDGERTAAIPCVRALLALDAGRVADAQDGIERALRVSPGDAFALLCKAEIEVRTGSPAAAAALADARRAAEANPFALTRDDVAALERDATGRSAAAS